MGIDTARFSGDIDGDLLCPICSFVLEDPVQAPNCEHVFCNTCITEWLTSNQTCPIDRTSLTINALKPAPRILRNFLSRLTLSCSNQAHGCPALLTLERLSAHILECHFNPKRLVPCQSGCGTSMPFEELQKHNCFQSLKLEIASNEEKISEMQSELDLQAIAQKENEEKMSKMQSELDLLKAEINALKKGNTEKHSTSSDSQLSPTAGQSKDTVFTDSRWLTNFEIETAESNGILNPMARPELVLRPCRLMLLHAQRRLSSSGCPLEMVKTLIENSNKSRWPPGLRSKEAQRASWNRIKDYYCRFGYDIVQSRKNHIPEYLTMCIIMASDNTHMDQDIFVINPGFLVLHCEPDLCPGRDLCDCIFGLDPDIDCQSFLVSY